MNPTNKTKLSALAALFVAFPRQEREGTEKQLLDVYLMAVEGIAPDFLAMACDRFIKGLVERPNLTFRPMPPELAVECRRLQDKAWDQKAAMARLPGPRMVPEQIPCKPFIPYPKLWDALEGEPELLATLKRMSFDEMTATSKTMAVEGIEAAKVKLRCIADIPYREARQKAGEAA